MYKYGNELEDFIKQHHKKYKKKELYKQSQTLGYHGSLNSFYKYVHRVTSQYVDPADKFLEIVTKQKISSIIDLSNKLNCTPKRILEYVEYYRCNGYEISINDQYIIFSKDAVSNGIEIENPLEDTEITFAIMSDPHFGSKACQITALNEFCEICRKKGVKQIFVPGDVVAGFNVYPGQMFDVYAISSEEQEESVIVNLPKGFEWYMLGGNHDYSFIKRGGGHNPLLVIENQRKDTHYIGFDQATIPLLPNVDAILWHPAGGIPYAYSYRLQKGIEQVAFSELTKISRDIKTKPTVKFMFAGHLHIELQAMFGNILGVQCGAFEGQSNYLKKKGLIPTVGGWIFNVDITSDGNLRSFSPKFYVFPDIIDDWKNYNHSLTKKQIISPIFI
jgi:UDP-2,3-diacylglucosamine pyrophosphatase LpxH